MNFHKYSQKFVILAALVWAVLAFFRLIPLRYIYVYFGAIVLYLGIQNMIILNLAVRQNKLPEKIKHYQERFGEKNGVIFYALFSVLMFIIFGIIIIISAYSIAL